MTDQPPPATEPVQTLPPMDGFYVYEHLQQCHGVSIGTIEASWDVDTSPTGLHNLLHGHHVSAKIPHIHTRTTSPKRPSA